MFSSTCQLLVAAVFMCSVGAQPGSLVLEDGRNEQGAVVAEAAGQQAAAAGLEARLAEAEAKTAQFHSMANSDLVTARKAAMMVGDAKTQVAAAQVRAAVYEQSARRASEAAQAELKEIEAIPESVAKLAAAEAQKLVRAEIAKAASQMAIVTPNFAEPGLPTHLAKAAADAATPYFDAMQKSIAMGDLYHQSANSLSDEARALQAESRRVASEAVTYQTAGNNVMAAKLMAQAKQMLTQAQAKDLQATKDSSVANDVLQQVPKYQADAALASAHAASLAGQPPPATSAKFLL